MVGASRVCSIASLFQLQPVLQSLTTHRQGNHLDQVFTNLKFTVNEIVPNESVEATTDHNPFLVRVCLSNRSIELTLPNLSQKQLKDLCRNELFQGAVRSKSDLFQTSLRPFMLDYLQRTSKTPKLWYPRGTPSVQMDDEVILFEEVI